ncbi:MAG: SDR family NAD(P)-dependent oxidoreductase, partial [Mangrovicoccus sp.]
MAIVITGATRGIGRGLRDHYADQGKNVYGTGRGNLPDDDHWISLDVGDPVSIRQMSQALDGVPVDLLVCNAGVYEDKGMKLADGFAAEVWERSFAVNVTGVFLCIQELLPQLQMSDAPRIAIMSSKMASNARAPGGSYAYRASKAAATNLGRNLASDLEPLGIAVGVYHPGWVRTSMGGQEAD